MSTALRSPAFESLRTALARSNLAAQNIPFNLESRAARSPFATNTMTQRPSINSFAPAKPAPFVQTPSTSSASGNASSGSKAKVTYTDEQLQVIHCNDKMVVVDAFAGCGKTTTAQGYALAHPKERILYMCLNKANQLEASKRFGSNVTPMTTHALAWGQVKPDRNRIAPSWKPIVLMDQMRTNDSREAMVAIRILNDFFNSSDRDISSKHAIGVMSDNDLQDSEINRGVDLARSAWKKMMDPNDKLQMPHDAYLKMFALRAPKLDFDTIIFDEAQDANPVTFQILQGQSHCKSICIGDRHQSIYGFRGAVDAMSIHLRNGATHLHLTQTWRFGPKIAATANLILNHMLGEKNSIKGMAQDGAWSPKHATILTRTNAELLRYAAPIRGKGVHWLGGVENYRIDQMLDAYHLYSGNRAMIKDTLMQRRFMNWNDYTRYAEDANDADARVLVSVVADFGDEIPALVRDIRLNAVIDEAKAEHTYTTGHKSKGQEWKCVQMAEDFKSLKDAEEHYSKNPDTAISEKLRQELQLTYVAVTRGKDAVKLNKETDTWVKNLDKHLHNREAAQLRNMASEQLASSDRPRG